MKTITLAGGCFWGVQAYFSQLKGIITTSVGYVDGNLKKPTYEQVCNHVATHTEAAQLKYDETLISLEKILEHFFRIVNPFSINRQGADIGPQYRSGIYYNDCSEEKAILKYMKNYFLNDIDRVAVVVKKNTDYELAEENHQKYLAKNPRGYCHINLGLATKEEVK